jgi:hypothetical protein
LEHKQSLGEAVDNVEVWITRILEDRKKVKDKREEARDEFQGGLNQLNVTRKALYLCKTMP